MAHRFLEKGRDGEEGSRVKREGVGRVEERTHTLTRGGEGSRRAFMNVKLQFLTEDLISWRKKKS